VLRVDSVESTPNPSAFLLKLDAPIEGLAAAGLRGETFRSTDRGRCPVGLADALATEGVDSLFACGQLLTVSKASSARWDRVLPSLIEALGGASGLLGGGPLGDIDIDAQGAAAAPSAASAGVSIRLQVSQKLPIQVEAAGWLGVDPPVRAKLSARFAGAMGRLLEASGDGGGAFFAERRWLERGMRYPDVEPDADDPIGSERRAVAAALEAEVAEVEAAYTEGRLASIVHGGGGGGAGGGGIGGGLEREPAAAAAAGGASEAGLAGELELAGELDLAGVGALCDADEAAEARGDAGASEAALRRLAAFVASAGGAAAARRSAIAYLGGSAGRGGDAVFEAVAAAFGGEKSAGLRRTAGDALSDLGDARALPIASLALADRSTLVRWRAARILGELSADAADAAALRQARLDEGRFEVAFEMADAARKVGARAAAAAAGEDGAAAAVVTGPMWKQIQEGQSGRAAVDAGDE